MNAVITSGQDVKINPQEIPESASNFFARITLRAMERYFEQPGIQEKFEAWLVEYRKREVVKK